MDQAARDAERLQAALQAAEAGTQGSRRIQHRRWGPCWPWPSSYGVRAKGIAAIRDPRSCWASRSTCAPSSGSSRRRRRTDPGGRLAIDRQPRGACRRHRAGVGRGRCTLGSQRSVVGPPPLAGSGGDDGALTPATRSIRRSTSAGGRCTCSNNRRKTGSLRPHLGRIVRADHRSLRSGGPIGAGG